MRALGLALTAIFVWAGGAQAKRDQTYAYPYMRVWTASLRMMRVDFESPITEKDPDAGYFLFDFPHSGKSYPGSVEVVRVKENGVDSARVVIQIAALPTYVEQMLLDRLVRKLGEDYGDPSQPKPAPKPDGGDKQPKQGESGSDGPSNERQREPQKPSAGAGAAK